MKTIMISEFEYNRLQQCDLLLQTLEALGVDNWSGWSTAWEVLELVDGGMEIADALEAVK